MSADFAAGFAKRHVRAGTVIWPVIEKNYSLPIPCFFYLRKPETIDI